MHRSPCHVNTCWDVGEREVLKDRVYAKWLASLRSSPMILSRCPHIRISARHVDGLGGAIVPRRHSHHAWCPRPSARATQLTGIHERNQVSVQTPAERHPAKGRPCVCLLHEAATTTMPRDCPPLVWRRPPTADGTWRITDRLLGKNYIMCVVCVLYAHVCCMSLHMYVVCVLYVLAHV